MSVNNSFSFLNQSSKSIFSKESFNESITEGDSWTINNLLKNVLSEYDEICAALNHDKPFVAEYKKSLNEIVSIHERAKELDENLGNLILAVFTKLCANILASVHKDDFCDILYRVAYSIANKVEVIDDEENILLKKLKANVLLECFINVEHEKQDNLEFNSSKIVDDLSLSNGNFQFLKSSVLDRAFKKFDKNLKIVFPSIANEFIEEEPFFKNILWACKRDIKFLHGKFIENLFSKFPLVPNADDVIKSPISLLDVKMFIASQLTYSLTTTEKGSRIKFEPKISNHLSITKSQLNCWKSVIDYSKTGSLSAINRIRISQLIDIVRLTNWGSEDVRVLFHTWKCCLQLSLKHDEDVNNSIKAISDIYRSKMNSLLTYGPCYSTEPMTLIKIGNERRNAKVLFPLQFDYEFVDVTEAEHIGCVINSMEGISKIDFSCGDHQKAESTVNEDDNSFMTASENYSEQSFSDKSQFFSPLKNNRKSMIPEEVKLFMKEEEQASANTSIVSTSSLILTPTIPEKDKDETNDMEDEEDEVDDLEQALLECERRDSKKTVAPKVVKDSLSPSSSTSPIPPTMKTPTKDVTTSTNDLDEMPPTPPSSQSACSSPSSNYDDEYIFNSILAETALRMRDLQFKKMGITINNQTNDDDDFIIREAELKLDSIASSLNVITERIKANHGMKVEKKAEHDEKQCFSCQT